MVMHEKSARKLKGATLYTVTLVISVMLILMLTAIALSGAVYRRASSEFRNDQTNTTARSVVTTILNSLNEQKDDDGDTLARNLANALKDVNDTVTLNVAGDSGSNVIPGFGTIESVTFTNVGKDDETGYFIQGSGENIIKVTATVSFGHDKTNTTTYTQYVTNSIQSEAESGGAGGFIAAGGMSLSSSTAPKFFGESYTGIDENAVVNVADFRNPAVIEGGAMFSSSVYFTTGNSRLELTSASGRGNGIYVNGNMGFLNDTTMDMNYKHSNISSVSDLPFFYVEGAVVFQNKLNVRGSGEGYNILAGRVLTTKRQPLNFNANIFCYNTDPGYVGITDVDQLIAHMNEGTLSGEADEAKMNSLSAEGPEAIDAFFKPDSGISIFEVENSSLLNWANDIVTGNKNGSIYSKGSVWLKGGIDVNDVVVGGALVIDCADRNINIRGNVIADTICLVDKSKLAIDGYVICNHEIGDQLSSMVGVSVSAPIPYSIEYYFPEGLASKEDVTGKNPDHPEYKIVRTRQDAVDQFYDKTQNKYKNSVNVSHLNISTDSKIYYQKGSSINYTTVGGSEHVGTPGAVDITESCTMAGTFSNCEIMITPSSGKELWINLFNVSLNNSKIIVDDSDGKVNFFIPMKENYCDEVASVATRNEYINAVNSILSEQSVQYNGLNNTFSADNGQIFTKRYYNDFLIQAGQTYNLKPIHLKTYYSDAEENDNVNGNYVPDINIYAADNVYLDDSNPTTDSHISPKIEFRNLCAVTGNLIAPYSVFDWANSAIREASNMSYTVAGADDPSSMDDVACISWIGSVLVGTIEKIQNDFTFFYVSHDPGGADKGAVDDIYKWDIIEGYATY